MATAGPSPPGTATGNSGAGTISWANPTNIEVDDSSYATFTSDEPSNSESHFLLATNFGFSLPGGATVNGVQVAIKRKETGADGIKDTRVQLVKGGTVQGDNKFSGSLWPTSDATATYGSVADLWGLTLSDTDVNASDFGVALAVQSPNTDASAVASVNYVTITVTYNASTATSSTGLLLGV